MPSKVWPRTGGRRRGAPLWVHLTALVLIPLMGVAALTIATVRTKVTEAASAARAEAAVQAVAQLDAARQGVQHEVIPVLSLGVLEDPGAAAAFGLPVFLLPAQRQQAQASVDTTSAATDTALSRVPAGSVGYAAARQAAADLAAVRAEAAAHTDDPAGLYRSYLAVSDHLQQAQLQAVQAANSQNVSVATLRATRDVQLVAAVAQSASRQMPLFAGAQLAAGDSAVVPQAFAAAWQDYTDAQRQMDEVSQAELRLQWDRVRTSPAVQDVDSALAAQAGTSAAAVPIIRLVALVNEGSQRDALLTGLLDNAVGQAQTLAVADRDLAIERRNRAIEAGLGILLASLLAALWLGRRVSRGLRTLAGQADQVSEGALVKVRVDGPLEVQRVSVALDSAVASLRRIQAQAEAVANGDLANSLLDEPLPGPLGEVVHASVQQIVSVVRQREALQFALAHQAAHDSLTDLPNREQARTLVTAALHRGQRSEEMTGLLFLDLDGFKVVNDSYGHACGDEVLREVARRLREAVRPGDVVCRLGGDEFVVLVERVQNERDLVDLAGRLIADISEPMTVGGQPVRVGASVGVAVSRDAGTDADALFADADTAAYRAKRNGRGRVEIFDEDLRLQLTARAELEAALAYGLAHGEMRLRYQPVIDVPTDRVTGYEALVRWERPGVGTVPPDEFIPAAEGSSLICDLDRWVLHEATRQLAEWRRTDPVASGEPEPTIAVNISGRHLAERRVVQDVTDALAASGLPAALLTLEVTETVLVDTPSAFANLSALRELGASIAIDDFGIGYTSIGQLRHMPVDTLKIDRSFIASSDPGHRELVALIIRAAHTFGLTVVAEGVEEPEQLAQLKAAACDHAQGYLLYHPLTPADAGALLRPLTGAVLGAPTH